MQAFLMNFGDNTRVVNDSNNTAVSIGIGELKECDIHDVHYHMIRRAVGNETLLVVPKDVKKTERLAAIMTLMQELMTEPYEEVLAKYNMLGDEDPDHIKIRPTRDQMRHQLKDLARQEVATALRLQSKVFIREQGDETTRKVVPPPQGDMRAPGDLPNPPPIRKPTKRPAKQAKKPVLKTRTRERL